MALVLVFLLSSLSSADPGSSKSAVDSKDGIVQAHLLVIHVGKEDATEAKAAVRTMKGVINAESVPDTQLVRILTNDLTVTVERTVKFLHLGGYQARKATEKEIGWAHESMQEETDRIVTFRSTGGSTERQAKTLDAAFPDTIAGRIARGYIEAFNSGDADTLRDFELKNRSKTALDSRTINDRLEQYKELYSSWGAVEVRGVEHNGEREISVEIFSKKNDTGFRAAFELEEGTDKLNFVRFMPSMMSVALPDATPDPSVKVTSIAESIEPLRTRFNEHKGKPRFVAILSPT
ncbi:MAG TPA: hypothetical protein PKN33_19825 [Phycisphaerae bacterium]|nr:hypothetical protein [Phycisphaerae bacterium]